jgi:hypothetical protein
MSGSACYALPHGMATISWSITISVDHLYCSTSYVAHATYTLVLYYNSNGELCLRAGILVRLGFCSVFNDWLMFVNSY